nr:MAG TPA: terminase small subunit [Caudoviricetes sp.]
MKKLEISNKFKKLLKDCNEEVRDYMESVMLGLLDDYGQIDDSYYASLRLIRDNYEIYTECYDAIKSNGTVEKDNQGRQVKNRHFTAMWEAQRNLQALLKAFAFTPMTKSKMKALSKGNGGQKSVLDEFLNSDD